MIAGAALVAALAAAGLGTLALRAPTVPAAVATVPPLGPLPSPPAPEVASTSSPAVEPVAHEAPPTEPSEVELRFVVRPARARVQVDGATVAGGVARVRRDGAEHELVVSSAGYRTERVRVRADQARTVQVTLERARRGRGERLPTTVASPVATPTPTPAPTMERARPRAPVIEADDF